MWPFKRKPIVRFEDHALTLPAAPCGEQTRHYMWEFNGVPCPMCKAAEARERKLDDDARMAQLIADAVVARLNQQRQSSPAG